MAHYFPSLSEGDSIELESHGKSLPSVTAWK